MKMPSQKGKKYLSVHPHLSLFLYRSFKKRNMENYSEYPTPAHHHRQSFPHFYIPWGSGQGGSRLIKTHNSQTALPSGKQGSWIYWARSDSVATTHRRSPLLAQRCLNKRCPTRFCESTNHNVYKYRIFGIRSIYQLKVKSQEKGLIWEFFNLHVFNCPE